MGHSSDRTALIYQHLANGCDHAITAHVDEQIKKVRQPIPLRVTRDASGT
ncbi:hypothetical protein ABID95_003871 [Streptomyces atratus]